MVPENAKVRNQTILCAMFALDEETSQSAQKYCEYLLFSHQSSSSDLVMWTPWSVLVLPKIVHFQDLLSGCSLATTSTGSIHSLQITSESESRHQ